jgi:hypothetical protein
VSRHCFSFFFSCPSLCLLFSYSSCLLLISRLVDVTEEEPIQQGLKYREGLSSWHSDLETFLINEKDETERKETIKRMGSLPSSIHPPSSSEANNFHLDRCLRILPHDQNTGGFFIAVIEKLQSTSDLLPSLKASNKTKKEQEPVQKSSSLQVVSKKKTTVQVMKEIGFNPKHDQSLESGLSFSAYSLLSSSFPVIFQQFSALFPFQSHHRSNYFFIVKREKDSSRVSLLPRR